MTHLKYEQRHLGDERWIDAGTDAFAVHTWAMAYCDEQDVDGVISRRMARRVALPVDSKAADPAIDRLIELGFWIDNGDGTLTIVDYLDHALAADEKAETRAKWAADKKRRNLHSIGNHSLCTPNSKCAVARGDSTSDSTSGDTSGSTASIPNPTRPNQTRPDQTPVGGSGSGSGSGGSDDQHPPHGSAAASAVTERVGDTRDASALPKVENRPMPLRSLPSLPAHLAKQEMKIQALVAAEARWQKKAHKWSVTPSDCCKASKTNPIHDTATAYLIESYPDDLADYIAALTARAGAA